MAAASAVEDVVDVGAVDDVPFCCCTEDAAESSILDMPKPHCEKQHDDARKKQMSMS